MTTAADNAALIVAALDLKLVQLLRGAMHSADIASGRPQAVSQLGPAPTPPPDRLVREPEFKPRPVYHPEPRFERRPVVNSAIRGAPCVQSTSHIERPVEVQVEPAPVVMKPEVESPLSPPWKELAWKTPVPPRAKVKVVRYQPDIINKGSLLDFFI